MIFSKWLESLPRSPESNVVPPHCQPMTMMICAVAFRH